MTRWLIIGLKTKSHSAIVSKTIPFMIEILPNNVHIQDNALKLGLTKAQGSYLVGMIGLSNTVARLILGGLAQKLNRLFLYNTCLVICGFTMCLSNFFQPITASMAGMDCSNETLSLMVDTSSTAATGEAVVNETISLIMNTTATGVTGEANMIYYLIYLYILILSFI